MKRSEALDHIEDLMFALVENKDIAVTDINGLDQIGLSTDIEEKILEFLLSMGMLPPLKPEYNNKTNKDLVSNIHTWEAE